MHCSKKLKNNKLLFCTVTVTVYIYTVTVAILKMNSIIEELMWVDFEQKCVK